MPEQTVTLTDAGFSIVDSVETLTTVDSVSPIQWHRNSLRCGDVELDKTSSKTNGLGAYVSDDKLYIDGIPIAQRTSTATKRGLEKVNDGVVFGNADFKRGDTNIGIKCINITLKDYNSLLAGSLVAGYQRFNRSAIYRIVDDISTATEVYFKRDGDHYTVGGVDYYDAPTEYGLYNNLKGYSQLGNHELSDNTFKLVDAPKVSIHDPVLRAKPGEKIKLTYMVDTHMCDMVNFDRIGDTSGSTDIHFTFTVIVKDKLGNVLYTNTTYAGIFTVELAPFVDEDDNNFVGETWYSVEVIDWRGVGSVVVFADILFEQEEQDRHYQMTASDLTTYGITMATLDNDGNVVGNNTPLIGYNNKVGFTRLFSDKAAELDDNNNLRYNGVKLYNPDGKTVYCIDYHKDIATAAQIESEIQQNIAHTPVLGTSPQFYVCTVKKVTSMVNTNTVTEYKIDTVQPITQGASITIEAGSRDVSDTDRTTKTHTWVSGTYTVDCDPMDWVIKDGAKLYRINDGTANNDKIWTRWYAEAAAEQANPLNFAFNSAYHKYYRTDEDNYAHPHLRTYTTKSDTKTTIDADDIVSITTVGCPFYFVKYQTDWDYVLFPDNFTVDFNNITWEAVYCIDLVSADIIRIEANTNTRLKNGKIVGLYDKYRQKTYKPADYQGTADDRGFGGFVENYMVTRTTPVGETLSTMTMYTSRFCSFENMEFSNSIGYDARVRGGYEKVAITENTGIGTPDISYSTHFDFSILGYVDLQGNVVTLNQEGDYITLLDYTSKEFSVKGLSYDATIGVSLVRSGYVAYRPTRTDVNGAVFFNEDCAFNGNFAYGSYYHLKQEEYFVSFYEKIDNEYVFIKTIKSKQWRTVKFPENCTHVVITAYGLSHVTGGERLALMWSKTSSGGTVKTANAAVYPLSRIKFYPRLQSVNTRFYNCYWHDTRSAAYSHETAFGTLYHKCRYKCIADLSDKSWIVTPLLGAHEDGRLNTDSSTLKECEVLSGHGYSGISFVNARNFTVCNNVGFSYTEHNHIDDCYVHDNAFLTISLARGPITPYPHAIYRRNTVGNNGYTSGHINVNTDIDENRSEEPPYVGITLEDYFANNNRKYNESHYWGIIRCKDGKIADEEYELEVLAQA